MIDRNFRRVKNISNDLEKHYLDYYKRNVNKFFTKWRFTESDLGSKFIKENEEYELIGQITEAIFFFKKTDDDTRWFINGDFLKQEFIRKKE